MSSLIKMFFFKQGETYYESDSNNFFSLKKTIDIYGYDVVHWIHWSRWFWRVQAVGRYALDHFVPVVLVGTLADRHAPADPFGRIGYID